MNMIPLEDHIYELQLELRYCRMSRHERAKTERLIAEAQAELNTRYRELDEAWAACWRGRGR